MLEELHFPIDFDKCPVCGSTRRVAEEIMKEEIEKGKIGEGIKAAVTIFQAIITDPRKLQLSVPVLITAIDVCADCGTVYCIHAEKRTGTPQHPIRGSGPSLGNFGFPQNQPGLS